LKIEMGKNITKAVTIVLLVSAVLMVFTATAFSDGPPTCSFAGTVKLDGADVADGSIITATIEGVEYTTTTPTGYGTSTYAITIQPGGNTYYADGTPVSFKITDYAADQTAIWQAGQNIRLDLTASTTTPPASSPVSSPNTWIIVGLVVACIAEVLLVGTVAYIAVSKWNR
jgi:hypothetical protein